MSFAHFARPSGYAISAAVMGPGPGKTAALSAFEPGPESDWRIPPAGNAAEVGQVDVRWKSVKDNTTTIAAALNKIHGHRNSSLRCIGGGLFAQSAPFNFIYGVKEYPISTWVAPLLGFIRYWE